MFLFSLRSIVELRERTSDAILDFGIVEVLVRDVNDNPPRIKTTILPPSQLQDEKGKFEKNFSIFPTINQHTGMIYRYQTTLIINFYFHIDKNTNFHQIFQSFSG